MPLISPGRERWTIAKAQAWAAGQPWLIGANYVPASAVNQIEMWQAATFDLVGIDRELGWAADLGMNSMRVFLHDLLWADDATGFIDRIASFLEVASRHCIRAMLVLFDGCWDPAPRLGPQPEPRPGVHNSRWVQSPRIADLRDPGQRARLRAYVEGVIGAFASDPRILAWDVWNEPDSPGGLGYPVQPDKLALVEGLLGPVFEWARSAGPSQPITSAVWRTGDWSPRGLDGVERVQVEQSDVLSFHDYRDGAGFEASARQLLDYGRPVLATEYLARGSGSTFEAVLPVAKRLRVGVFNWGFVDGRTQTKFPWDSWDAPYAGEPEPWYHDVLRADGTAYRESEAELMRAVADAPTS